MEFNPIVYVADAGSVAAKNYHWVCSRTLSESSPSPMDLAKSIVADLNNNLKVALGYESPLYVPCSESADDLGRARNGESDRAWSASAGAAVLATGIQSLAWVLRQIKRDFPDASATTVWEEFRCGSANLFVWEAFVSGSEKAFPADHAGDARLAIDAFINGGRDVAPETRIKCPEAFSLVGAAILFAGLSKNLAILQQPCIVLRPIFSAEEALQRRDGYRQRKAAIRTLKKLAKAAELEQAIKANLKGLGYGE